MNKTSTNKSLVINLVSALVVFAINLLISFLLTPYIVKTLGGDANAFVTMANTFVSYITIITVALNSMASRFITIALVNGNKQEADEFYSSTFAGNVALMGILTIPVTLGIVFLDKFLKISPDLVMPVKLLFMFVFISFFISTVMPVWNVAAFATNRVYLQSIGNMISNGTRALVIVLLFACFPTKLWYVGLAGVVSMVALQIWQFSYKRRILKDLRVKVKNIHFSRIKELLATGIWNSVNQLGVLLFGGLDLILANAFATEWMKIIAVAQVVPNFLGSLQGTITSVFTPNMTIMYAKRKIDALKQEFFKAGKINIALLGIPFAILLTFGLDFFALWMPKMDSTHLQVLSILYSLNYAVVVGTAPLWNSFIIVNKTKANSNSVIISGVISVAATIVALEYTHSLGAAIAICGISSIISILRNVVFVIPVSAKYLGLKWTTFFPLLGYTLLNFGVDILIGLIIRHFIPVHSWLTLAFAAILLMIFSLGFGLFGILNKSERAFVLRIFIK
ncbi:MULTISPECIES: hypothetical protein [unclassified Lactococcus]|uniref:hypothetical protein n=3 Tax=Lactococcus TaxID=1357 RepID=UPI0011C8F22F|nr:MULTISPECIES: hypothetical protein [unclassified Lactococcus]MQW23456.1 hypothetical protein [Lactococcus sp. dk101]TXK36871.1 hypothetical protein FVP42_10495 [Lactococcus sp. dk310]